MFSFCVTGTSSSDDDLPMSFIITENWYEGHKRLPVYRWCLEQGIKTREAIQTVLSATSGKNCIRCSDIHRQKRSISGGH